MRIRTRRPMLKRRHNAKMGKVLDWDFELRLASADRATFPMARLAEYLTQWANLLGPTNRPVFQGLVKGSVRIRACVHATAKAETAHRIRNAQLDPDAAPFVQKLERMVAQDGFRYGRIRDRSGRDLLRVVPSPEPLVEAMTVTDSVEIDGWVCRVEGRDKTTHIGLVEAGTGRSIALQTTSDPLAVRFAQHFRGSSLRVRTHGTWTRSLEGVWEPKALTADDFEVLDDTPAGAVLEQLRGIPGNNWATMEDHEQRWREIRGLPVDSDDETKSQ